MDRLIRCFDIMSEEGNRIVLSERRSNSISYETNVGTRRRAALRRRRAQADFNSMVAERTFGTAIGTVLAAAPTAYITHIVTRK